MEVFTMATATAQDLLPAIGQTVLVSMEKLSIRCTVLNVRQVYGQMQLNVSPADGLSTGEQWVSMSRIQRPRVTPSADLLARRAEAMRQGDSGLIGEIESQIILEGKQ
jgi:hypothetical protein